MITKLRLVFTIAIVFLSFYGFAQSTYWHQEALQKASDQILTRRLDVKKGLVYSLKTNAFQEELTTLSTSKNASKVIYFPNENGKLIAFEVSESSVFAPELAAKYPNIKSYKGNAVGNSKDKIRFSVSHKGFQGMMTHSGDENSTFIQKTEDDRYLIYSRDSKDVVDDSFTCTTASNSTKQSSDTHKLVDAQVLRTYRLAVSASGEYTAYHGGTVADALAGMNATLTRINEVFETDLGIRLELIANNDQIIYTDASTDPYTGSLNSQVQNTLTNVIGEANYDVGHLFHVANDNGNSGFIGAVCTDGDKGSAFTSAITPEGDRFDLDFVSHELGHQFGANHTWSHRSEGTTVQVEPASGTTIMGYAGITGVNNVALVGDDYFHYASIVQITDYIATTSCAVETSLTNTPPQVVPVGDFVIPIGTAFVLTGEATDADAADQLTYTWEQIDNGIVTQSSFGPTNPSGANFRSLKPSTSPKRYFPKLSSVIQGNLTQTLPPVNTAWETISNVQREMNFALTVRDNAIGGGQVVSDLVNVSVVNNSGPFVVTSQETSVSLTAGDIETITWNVANTNLPPVNAQNVDILLSIDGGVSFPISLAENISNDGSFDLVLPQLTTSHARIMIKASDTIFYAVNAIDFTIVESPIVLNFDELEFDVCQPNDVIVDFIYEAATDFNEEVTFSVVSPPAGLAVAFSPLTTVANNTPIEITFSDTQNLAVGNYPIQILATSNTESKEITIDLNVFDDTYNDVILTSPSNTAVDVSAEVLLEWEEALNIVSYDIQIATDIGFVNIVESGSSFTNSYLPSSLENSVDYFWRVKPKNNCGEGNFGAPFSFKTIVFNCINKSANDLPIEISSSGTPTVVSKLSFAEDVTIADVDVTLNIEHTFLGDLVVNLTSPTGTTVTLISNSCDMLRNVTATFDDDASGVFVCGGNPAISGRVKGVGALNAFNGESLLGEWTLTVNDNVSLDGGVLVSFSMDVCTEGVFRPDEDSDGVFDDGPDLCLGTPLGVEVDVNGCSIFRFPNDNFLFELQSESCQMNNDGQINIAADILLDYTISVEGGDINITDTFTNTFSLSQLMAGSYRVCINATDGAAVYEEKCFDVVVSQPDDLGVTSKIALNEKTITLALQGANLYTVELNGIAVQTKESSITLDLSEGDNTLKVFTSLPCQGVYEEQILVTGNAIIHPNPFIDFVTISFREEVIEDVEVEIYMANGQFVQKKKYQVNGVSINVDMSTLSTGLYFIRYTGKNIKGTSKVMKL